MAASFIYIQLFITQHYTKRLYHKNKRLGMTIIYNIFERLGKAFESLRTILVPWNRAFLRCSRHLHASNFTKPRSCNHGVARYTLLPRIKQYSHLKDSLSGVGEGGLKSSSSLKWHWHQFELLTHTYSKSIFCPELRPFRGVRSRLAP